MKRKEIGGVVARMWDKIEMYSVLLGNLREKDHLEDLGTN